MVTTAEYIQNGQAQLLACQNAMTNLNQALTLLGIANITPSTSFASLATTIAVTTITSVV